MLGEFYVKNKIYIIVFGIILLFLVIAWFNGLFSKECSTEINTNENIKEKINPHMDIMNRDQINGIADQLNYLQKPIENLENTGENIKVYNFNTSWCRYSVLFAPEWTKFMSLVESNNNIEAFDVKCDDDNNKEFCSTFSVRGYPSVVIVKDGKQIEYSGPRNAEKILEFVNNL